MAVHQRVDDIGKKLMGCGCLIILIGGVLFLIAVVLSILTS